MRELAIVLTLGFAAADLRRDRPRSRGLGLVDVVMLLALVAIVSACSSNKPAPVNASAVAAGKGTGTGAGAKGPAAGGATTTEPTAVSFGPIYFAYDQATLTEEARAELERARTFLGKHPEARLLVAGHADERGTPEYNLALGEERARVCRDYLTRLGVDVAQLRTISYGEEQPAVTGDDEVSYVKNRRAELDLGR
jgi:peptidoglycan-associated lipoprotein